MWPSILTSETAWHQFLCSCNENIHIVICSTPLETFRQCYRYKKYFINDVYINWMESWAENVLIKVANCFLTDHPSIPEVHRESIIGHTVHVHCSIDSYAIEHELLFKWRIFFTPKHFIRYIQTFLRIMSALNSCLVF